MNIAQIILLSSAIFSAIVAYVFYRYMLKYKTKYNNIASNYRRIDAKLHARKQMDKDTSPWYSIEYINHPEHPDDDFYPEKVLAVVRNTCVGQYWSDSVIKVFTDKDESYNQRCAEELLEKLTEK